jgi:hypothetical protein
MGLLAAIVLVGTVTVPILRMFEASGTWQRIVVAAGLVGSVGVFMGVALPTGMRVATSSASDLIPWLWGINGATSVLGSVLAAAIALAYGISVSYWTGVACYAAACAAFALNRRRHGRNLQLLDQELRNCRGTTTDSAEEEHCQAGEHIQAAFAEQ